MSFINNNYGEIKVDKQVNITATPTTNNSSSTGSTPNTNVEEEKPFTQLTNRQVVIMMTALMDISLSAEYTNQQQLARLLSSLTGRSTKSIRQTIMKLAKEGIETTEACRDCFLVADLLEPFCPIIAQHIRNDAKE